MTTSTMHLQIESEVAAALAAGGPVVALESTILAHGLPWPENLQVGQALEAAVRAGGAVPATIAVLDGTPCVGLSAAQLERVARDGAKIAKAGAADLAVAFARGTSAATTVSATCTLAARAGVRVFATGAIGGVHRGDAGDVSSDLTTMAREPVAVVSAGAKAILDLPRTAEMLETLGVLVLGYGTDELPAFYTRRSGVKLEHRVDDAGTVARILAARWALGQGGVLVANPIPEADALDPSVVTAALAAALGAADAAGISGKALTPFLLAELSKVTSGASVRANRALALANARLGAEIAVALSRLAPAP
jgi:pseudouridine-5'-phosphate glycosidase